jgi:hypothetical protein
MLDFTRIQAGIYQARQDGAKININREGQSYWALRLDGEFVESYQTLGDARVAAQALVGTSPQGAHVVSETKAAKPPKPPKLPAIMHNPRGLYIFGLDDICKVLELQEGNGICRPHVTKRGKPGYFLDLEKAKEFWLLSVEEPYQGTKVLEFNRGTKTETTL